MSDDVATAFLGGLCLVVFLAVFGFGMVGSNATWDNWFKDGVKRGWVERHGQLYRVAPMDVK